MLSNKTSNRTGFIYFDFWAKVVELDIRLLAFGDRPEVGKAVNKTVGTFWEAFVFLLKSKPNGKKVGPFRLGDEKDASQQSQFRHPRRLFGGVAGRSSENQASSRQRKQPEYWVIKTGKFRNRVNNRLDEWIYFLKNAEIKPTFSAKGLKEANEKLDTMKLPEKERIAYDKYLRHLMSIASRNHTIEIEAKEIIKKAKEEKEIEFVLRLYSKGKTLDEINDLTGLPIETVAQIVENYSNKSPN